MNNKSKTIFIPFMVAGMMTFSSLGAAAISLSKSKITREVLEAYSSSVSLSNEEFTNPTISSSTNLPTNPSSWTTIDKTENATAGIITLDTDIASTEKVENSYKLSSLPREYTGMSDKQVLMLNAGTSQAATGYKSESLSLSTQSYYVVSFKAYSQVGSFGSARLSGNEELEKTENILNVNTNGMWIEHKIYVQTSDLESVSANLELWLGVKGQNESAGAVFFDNVSVSSYDATTFNAMLKNDIATNAHIKSINLQRTYLAGVIANASFESALGEEWSLIEESTLHAGNETLHGRINVENFNKADAGIEDEIENNNVYNNKFALFINNLQSGKVGYQSAYFTIPAKALYKISFLAKTGSLEGNAVAKLVERNPYTNQKLSNGADNPNYYANSSYESQTFTISDISTSSYSNEYTNGWKEYSFYVQGNSLIDTEMNLEFWLGSDEDAKGYVFFDNLTVEQLTSNEFTSNSSNGTVANLNQNTTETSFKNGAFNLFTIDNVDDGYPYAPESWTLSSIQSNEAKNGIINTTENNISLGIPEIPAVNPSYPNNNVLMIGNVANNSQSYTSTSATLSANSYYKLTLNVLSTELVNAKAGITLYNDETIIGEITNISTEGQWKKYTILVKTGYEDMSVKLKLSLGQYVEGTGYAFFDNVILSSSLTENDYSAIEADKKIDLSKNDWSNIPAVSTSTQGIYTTNTWTASSTEGANVGAITAGVIDTTKYGEADGYNESSFDAPGRPEGEGKNVLMIKSTEDTYYKYSSNLSSKFESGSYYKVKVQVKTDRLSQLEENKQYKDSNNTKLYPYGASIRVNGIDASFTGINTNGDWKTYTIYVNSTNDNDVYLELSLGSENALTSGVVYFSTTSIEKIDEDEYREGIAPLEEDESIDNILAIGNTDEQENEEENNNNSTNDGGFNWLLVPSIITGVAILVAVVGVIWRKYRKTAPKKAKIQKPYSKENMKKLAESHKREISQFKEQEFKLQARQNHLADQLNKARQNKSDNVEKLEKEYQDVKDKLEELATRKKESNKKYRQKVDDLKAMELAEKKRK